MQWTESADQILTDLYKQFGSPVGHYGRDRQLLIAFSRKFNEKSNAGIPGHMILDRLRYLEAQKLLPEVKGKPAFSVSMTW